MQAVKLIKIFLKAFPCDQAPLSDYSNKYTVAYLSEYFKRTKTSAQNKIVTVM